MVLTIYMWNVINELNYFLEMPHFSDFLEVLDVQAFSGI